MGHSEDHTASARWERVQEEFHRLADQPRHIQEEALHALEAEDAEVADELRSMLAADSAGATLLDRGVAAAAQELLGDEPTALPRVAFGPYRAERFLGAGGSGVVYLGYRADLDAHAAVKVLREAWLSPQRRERFHLEQRVLASLEHPHIARLLDADSLDDGTPWIALEYVEGKPLVEWAQANALTLEQRLQLFRQVCDTMRFAHDRGVIHRDLKPANVLVNAEGQAKLLDFGIARWAVRTDADTTVTALRMLTPAYASPEQLRGAPADVQQDVYALGIMLFELLTGSRPYTLPDLPRVEAAAFLVQQNPPLPSQRLSTASFPAAVPLASISRAEWRDLDALVTTAMHPDVTRRYRSVEALLRDLDAFAERGPLAARPDTTSERFIRLLRRHKRRLTMAGALLLAVVVTLTAWTRSVTRARDMAEREANRSARITEFLVNLLSGDDEGSGPADSLLVRTVVAQATRDLPRLSRDPETHADLLVLLGRVNLQLGDVELADSLLRAGERAQRAVHPSLTRAALSAAALRASIAMQRGQTDSARAVLEALNAEAMRAFPDDPAIQAEMAEGLGTVYDELGDYDAATDVVARAVQLRAMVDSTDIKYADAISTLSNIYYYRGLYDSSRVLNVRAAALTESLLGPDNPSLAHNLVNIGIIDQRLGKPAEGEQPLRRALGIMERWYGPEHYRAAGVITQLVGVLVELDRASEARPLQERAVRIIRATFGPESPRLATALTQLGGVVRALGEYDEALALARQAHGIYSKANGPDHQFTLITANNIAGHLLGMRRFDEAAVILEDVVARYRRTVGPDDQNLAIGILRLGQARFQQRRWRDAIALGEEGLAVYRRTVTSKTGVSIAGNVLLARSHAALGDSAAAARYARDTLP